MSFRTNEGKWRRPKIILPPPKVTDIITNREFWKNKIMSYLGSKKFYDQDIRTGICYFCKKENRAQRSRITVLHHVKYYHQDPLAWTIEVCTKCHWQIDEYNKKLIDSHYGRKGR